MPCDSMTWAHGEEVRTLRAGHAVVVAHCETDELARRFAANDDLISLAQLIVTAARNADGWAEYRHMLEGQARITLAKIQSL